MKYFNILSVGSPQDLKVDVRTAADSAPRRHGWLYKNVGEEPGASRKVNSNPIFTESAAIDRYASHRGPKEKKIDMRDDQIT